MSLTREELENLYDKDIGRTSIYRSIFLRDLGICKLCNKPIDPTIHHRKSSYVGTLDHIIPTSKGGATRMSNLQLAHQHCNIKKGNDYNGPHMTIKRIAKVPFRKEVLSSITY